MTEEELHNLEDHACPGAGACGGQFTANTMSIAFEFMGISPMGFNGVPALDPQKETVSTQCGQLVMELLKHDVRPKQIITRAALENGIAAVASTGGSTNAVLHIMALAHEMGIPLSLDDFDTINQRTPLLADLKPGRQIYGSRFVSGRWDQTGCQTFDGRRNFTRRSTHRDPTYAG